MKISTYDTLIAEAKNWSGRSDLTDDQYNSFTYFAGSMANQLLRITPMERTTILDISPDGHVVIPPDFLELKAATAVFGANDSLPLQRVAWDQYVMYLNGAAPGDTATRFIAQQGSYLFVAPLPPSGSKITMHYYAAMPDINHEEQTNWLVQVSPLTYLYGTLHFLHLFVFDEERAEYWLGKMQGELTRLQLLDDNAKYAGTSLAVRNRTQEGDAPDGL